MIELLNVYKTFGKKSILRDISLKIVQGRALGLVGKSGAGKTTLAHLLLGKTTPTSGTILFEGEDIALFSRAEKKAFGQKVQLIFQNPYSSLNPRMQVTDIIQEPLLIHKKQKRVDSRELLLAVGLKPEDAKKYPHQFSGGQRQRIAIARALALEPRLLICDEALASLDLVAQLEIISLLKQLREDRGLTYLFISHNLLAVRLVATEIVTLADEPIQLKKLTIF